MGEEFVELFLGDVAVTEIHRDEQDLTLGMRLPGEDPPDLVCA